MNSEYEPNDMNATSLEALTRINGQAVETRQRIPYDVTVYAVPEQRREEEQTILDEQDFNEFLAQMDAEEESTWQQRM